VVIIPLTFDEDIFKPGIDVTELKKTYGVRDEKILMYIGRLHPVKRLDLLLKAAAQLHEHFKLFIVGSGALEDELQRHDKIPWALRTRWFSRAQCNIPTCRIHEYGRLDRADQFNGRAAERF